MNEEGLLIFQHYEKATASHNILHARSAQALSCRNSVHTQEILRRLLNSSPLLDWKTWLAPVLSEYMRRMMHSGYPEKYRIDTLSRSLNIYDKMVAEDSSGTRPLYWPKDWNVVARRKEKEKRKYSWSTRGGHVAPIFVPPTPDSELANCLKFIADREAEAGVHFKIVETGGISLKSVMQRSNPLETPGCDRSDCFPCKQVKGEGGQREACGIQYQVQYQFCPQDQKAVYIGKSSRNLCTKSLEHMSDYMTGTNNQHILHCKKPKRPKEDRKQCS